jgi:hypothetical protein
MAKVVSWVFDTAMLFNVACDNASSIEAPPRKGSQKPALVSIVFSVLTLEAFMNELAEFALTSDMEQPPVIDVLAEFLKDSEESNASLETKFTVGSWILTGKRFERGKQPFQDFALLVRLRNDIVHFKANDRFEEGVPVGKRHANLISKFRDKNILAEDTREDILSSWSHLIQTKAAAEWSCKTAARMVMDFYKKLPSGDFRDSIVPYEEDYDAEKLFCGAPKTKAARRAKYFCNECDWDSGWISNADSEPPHVCTNPKAPSLGGAGEAKNGGQ